MADKLDLLGAHPCAKVLDEIGTRYGIHTSQVFGVPMAQMKHLGKQIGVNHPLALALCDTGCYEAQIFAAMVDDPGSVAACKWTAGASFDTWAICDTV